MKYEQTAREVTAVRNNYKHVVTRVFACSANVNVIQKVK